MKNVWKRYVETVMDGASQVQGQRDTGIAQTTIGRWLNGEKVPTEAAKVAAFALGYGRNVLEAFVAAGMLSIADAQRGLDESSIAMLEQLDDTAVDELAARRSRKTAEPSVGDPNVAHLIGEPSAASPEPRNDVEGDEDPEGP